MLQDPINLGLVEAHGIIGTGFTSQVSSQLCSNCCLTDTAGPGGKEGGGWGYTETARWSNQARECLVDIDGTPYQARTSHLPF